MSELKPLKLELIVEDVEIVLSTLEAIAEIPRFEDVESTPDDAFLGPAWIYDEIEYNRLWSELAGPLKRLRVVLNDGEVELIDCRQRVREILHELWKWVCRYESKPEYRLGGLSIHDSDFGICDDCSAAEPAILYDTRRLYERLRAIRSESEFSETVSRTHRPNGGQGEPTKAIGNPNGVDEPPALDATQTTMDGLRGRTMRLFRFIVGRPHKTRYEELRDESDVFTKVEITDDGIKTGIKDLVRDLDAINAPFIVEWSHADRWVKLVNKPQLNQGLD
ncbi:MAG: hypothetical protein H6822_22450 [Planctomycetaceae bacterium]|nr:hypothetical protein [Planctomycetales bacterium]MCB9924957.1 hypothetical protein [Planctomycetaceae bacterium]